MTHFQLYCASSSSEGRGDVQSLLPSLQNPVYSVSAFSVYQASATKQCTEADQGPTVSCVLGIKIVKVQGYAQCDKSVLVPKTIDS